MDLTDDGTGRPPVHQTIKTGPSTASGPSLTIARMSRLAREHGDGRAARRSDAARTFAPASAVVTGRRRASGQRPRRAEPLGAATSVAQWFQALGVLILAWWVERRQLLSRPAAHDTHECGAAEAH